EVEATCDRILIINKGRIVADGTADILRRQASGSAVLNVRIEDGDASVVLPALNRLSSVEKAVASDQAANRYEVQTKAGQFSNREIFHMCVQNGWVLTEAIPVETRLEDIFRNLTMN
ncbi:MAG TPA: gliding motility-associated ABC transporter ATP-binding subunit GldA, partial [Chryseosolibacter sp.]|nr:gliding motility-associated ABC transporter ATP-binding subunit GldA [Chryseosolibacter sp.]